MAQVRFFSGGGQRLRDGQCLANAADDAAELDQCDHGENQPEPAKPVDSYFWSGDFVESCKCGLAAGDGIAPELDLHKDLDQAADDDQP